MNRDYEILRNLALLDLSRFAKAEGLDISGTHIEEYAGAGLGNRKFCLLRGSGADRVELASVIYYNYAEPSYRLLAESKLESLIESLKQVAGADWEID